MSTVRFRPHMPSPIISQGAIAEHPRLRLGKRLRLPQLAEKSRVASVCPSAASPMHIRDRPYCEKDGGSQVSAELTQ